MGEGLQNRDVAWTSPPPRVEKPRVSGIDLFRGALVILVILGHFAELSQRHHFLTWSFIVCFILALCHARSEASLKSTALFAMLKI